MHAIQHSAIHDPILDKVYLILWFWYTLLSDPILDKVYLILWFWYNLLSDPILDIRQGVPDPVVLVHSTI